MAGAIGRFRKAAGAAALAAVLLLPSAARAQDLAKAEALRGEGKFAEAAAEFEKVLAAEPENPRALFGMGVCKAETGRLEPNLEALWASRKYLEKAAALSSGSAEVRFWNGWTAAQLIPHSPSFAPALRETAEAELREALRLDPSLWDARFQLGQVLEGKGDAAGAVEAWTQAVGAAPDRLEPYPVLALAQIRLGRLDDAVATASELLKRAPDYAFAHKILGDAEAARPDFERAQACYLRGQEAEPANPLWCASVASLFAQSKRYDAAEAVFRALTARHPDLEAPRRNLAAALAAQDKHDEAAREFGELTKRFPEGFVPWQGLAVSLEKSGRIEEAMSAHLEALRLLPSDYATALYDGLRLLPSERIAREYGHPYTPLKARFEGLRLSGKFKDAAELLRRVVAAGPEPKLLCWAWWELAENLQQLGDAAGTLDALAQAIEIDPLEPRFRNSRGLFHITLDRADLAIAEFLAAIEISPGFMYSIENLAATYHRLHQDAKAREWFEKGLAEAQDQHRIAVDKDKEAEAEREFDIFKFGYFLHELESVEAAGKKK